MNFLLNVIQRIVFELLSRQESYLEKIVENSTYDYVREKLLTEIYSKETETIIVGPVVFVFRWCVEIVLN